MPFCGYLLTEFFNHWFTTRKISACPLPFFIKTNSAIGQNFGSWKTFSSHQFAFNVQMLIAHFQRIIFQNFCNQIAETNCAAGVFCSNYIVFLVIIKRCFAGNFTCFRILHGFENAPVVVDFTHLLRPSSDCLIRAFSGWRHRRKSPAAKDSRKTFSSLRAFRVCLWAANVFR